MHGTAPAPVGEHAELRVAINNVIEHRGPRLTDTDAPFVPKHRVVVHCGIRCGDPDAPAGIVIDQVVIRPVMRPIDKRNADTW